MTTTSAMFWSDETLNERLASLTEPGLAAPTSNAALADLKRPGMVEEIIERRRADDLVTAPISTSPTKRPCRCRLEGSAIALGQTQSGLL